MHTRDISVGGRTISIETGKLAKQADGAVIVRSGDTMVLVTACHAANPREGIDFLPLTVDYREYTYASGRIPGGFFKREGKPAEKEVLTSRLIDRPIRPLFPAGWRYETQIIALRDLGRHRERLGRARDHRRVGGARALVDPVREDDRRRARRPGRRRVRHQPDLRASASSSKIDLIVAGSKDAIMMVEAGAKEVAEEEMVEALERGARGDQGDRRRRSTRWRSEAGKTKKTGRDEGDRRTTFYREVEAKAYEPLAEAMRIKDKLENYGTRRQGRSPSSSPSYPEDRGRAARRRQGDLQGAQGKGHARRDPRARQAARRPRASTRSARSRSRSACCRAPTARRVFTRGETQALVTATLGTDDDQQKIETVDGETYKRFMLHYNFPPFSVGEVQFLRGPGRREIGHGALAERALAPLMPDRREVPLHRPRRLRHPRVERLVVDGVGLRRRRWR